MKMIMVMHMFSSSMFILMKHPLSMGFILLVQTALSCLMNSMNTKSTWFSMILFITFVGGMMIMFIYMASIASNEKFKLSKKMIIYSPIIIYLLTMMKKEKSNMIMEETMLKNMKIYNKEMISLMKTFNYPTMMISLMMIVYLLITMIVVVKITNIKEGPLRLKN